MFRYVLIGCVPVDGDTYDVPANIETAETRLRVLQDFPMHARSAKGAIQPV